MVRNSFSGCSWRTASTISSLVFALLCAVPSSVAAQEPPPIPEEYNEPQGFIAEPDVLTRVVLFADRHFGKGDLNSGFFWQYGKLIPGAGWASGGAGYRRWYGKDTMVAETSAAISTNNFRTAQARVLLPTFARSRLALGAQVRWIDFDDVDFFGVGPGTSESALTTYDIGATHVVAHATLRPARWFDIDAEIGLFDPSITDVDEISIDQPSFMPAQVSMTIDTRNYREHPTSGVLLRGAAAHYEDRDGGAFTHKRYEAEAAGFVPMFGERVVLALHGLAVTTPLEDGDVPFYLLPNLGGATSLRSFTDYRFHDRSMLLANAEVRLKMMTHVDLAVFADAGNVAPRFEDLDLEKRSYGAGLRLHTRRQTFARLDVANGSEGWRILLRLTDPLAFSRLERRALVAPWVP